ncbi:MAG TPA: arsenite methyltransferase [Candidatus Diapherotrites archaeon]|uniref:Arsenite methyltransferase n=1 Tax=Candidatus Iainarchaeum sp. TaxID=3101447 RepID=A0A7J4IXW7_9ARCH|nr:arsenite methyltransferase [Candidatus Diapherotrites archaeon]
MEKESIKRIVKESYKKIAESGENGCGCACGCTGQDKEQISASLGYSDAEINMVPEANLGLGCGNPIALGEIKEGMSVLDLGSGGGIDCFLAAKKVGPKGKVIGVDMTEKMIQLAQRNAKKYGFENVEFRLGDIEELPVENNSVDVVISNCVINLAPDKSKVFREAHRVLKNGGHFFVSDIVLLKELSEWQREDKELIAGCVGGAIMRDEYLKLVIGAGFDVKVIGEDIAISKRQYNGMPLESLRIAAQKQS